MLKADHQLSLILTRLCFPLRAALCTWVGRTGIGGCLGWREPQCRRGEGRAGGLQVRRVQMAEKPMGCLRVELAEHEGHDPHELQLEVDRGILSAQPGISSWVVVVRVN